MYTFNLIVGIGVLALPKAFNRSGLLLGIVLLLILCLVRYVDHKLPKDKLIMIIMMSCSIMKTRVSCSRKLKQLVNFMLKDNDFLISFV